MRIIFLILNALLLATSLSAQWTDNGINLTTSDNVFVNGTLDVSGNTAIHRLTISSSGASSNTTAVLYRATNNINSGNQLIWRNNNAVGTQITTGYMHSVLRTNALDSETAKWEFNGLVNGTQTEMLEFGGHGFIFKPQGTTLMSINSNGTVGIGTTSTGSHKLAVEGSIGAREIKVEASGWSDFVFESDYELRTLEQVATYIAENKHLPEIPSEAEVTENGINLGEMNAKLLQKIEELTLYLIEGHNANQKLRKEVEQLKKEVSALKNE